MGPIPFSLESPKMALSSWSLSCRTVESSQPDPLLRTLSSQSVAPAIAMVTASCCLAPPAWGQRKGSLEMCKLGSPALPVALGGGRERLHWGPLVVSDGLFPQGSQEVQKAYIPSFLHTVIGVYKDKGSFAKGVLLFLHPHIHACILSLWYAL